MIPTIWTMLIGSSLLPMPYVWECSDDSPGDKNKRQDVKVRGLIMITVSIVNALLNGGNSREGIISVFLLSFNTSVAWFFMFFDYTIAWILIRRKIVEAPRVTWFDYLGKVGEVDNWKPWRNLTAKRRFWIRAGYFVVSTAVYVLYLVFRK